MAYKLYGMIKNIKKFAVGNWNWCKRYLENWEIVELKYKTETVAEILRN